MKLHNDRKADALYLRLDDSAIVESEEMEPGAIFDYNEQEQVVGIEILRLKERVPGANLSRVTFEVAE